MCPNAKEQMLMNANPLQMIRPRMRCVPIHGQVVKQDASTQLQGGDADKGVSNVGRNVMFRDLPRTVTTPERRSEATQLPRALARNPFITTIMLDRYITQRRAFKAEKALQCRQ